MGQRAAISLKNGNKICGILEQIYLQGICIRDTMTGLEIKIPNTDIQKLSFEGYSKERKINNMELLRFKRQCERYAEEANITLGKFFSFDIVYYAKHCDNNDLKEYLLSETQNRGGKYTVGEMEEYYEYLLSDEEQMTDCSRGFYIINILMLFRMRKYDSAVANAIGILGEEDIVDATLIMVCLMTQMKNHIESLFWLERYYTFERVSMKNQDHIWWFYLKMISKYSAYEHLVPLLKNMAHTSPKTAIQSLSYLLLANNSVSFAAQLLDCVDEYLTEEEAVGLIDRNSGYLISDCDNNYHRFLRCMERIIDNQAFVEYVDSQDINGYIYDYVPDKEFGFILGFDMVVYFFRKESVNSDNVNRHIKDNICSTLSVDEEDLILVTFKRTLESKRSYNAIDII